MISIWIFPQYKPGEGGTNEWLPSIYIKSIMFLDSFIWEQITENKIKTVFSLWLLEKGNSEVCNLDIAY